MNLKRILKIRLTNKGKRFFTRLAIIASLCVISIIIISNPEELFSKNQTASTENESENEAEYFESDTISINEYISNEVSDYEDLEHLDKSINKFLKRWNIRGGALAVYNNQKLIYSKGYGLADVEQNIAASPSNLFRIASMSKLITATAIMKLQEDSLLTIKDTVFGPRGILNMPKFLNIRDRHMKEITVEQLMRHYGGFSLRRGDPLFTVRDIMRWDHLDTVPDMDGIIEHVLTKERLSYRPGSTFCYSNLGYLILSKIIEVKSGQNYEDYCQEHVLHPAGCFDMHLAKNLYKDKYPNEVRYYEPVTATKIPVYDANSSDSLYRSYGGNNIEGLYGAGGWIASPIEFGRFVLAIDGKDSIPDIISKESVATMTEHNKHTIHPLGWVEIRSNGDWVRTGSLSGSSSICKYQKNGLLWVFEMNSSSWKGSKFPHYTDYMFRSASYHVKWPDTDLLLKSGYLSDVSNKKSSISNQRLLN
ncbi:MAG: serine hydrolase domain-containing protein [Bacteroidales bacterium]